MNRNVVSSRDVATLRATLGPGEDANLPVADNFGDRLVKYIPPDVIGAYTAIQSTIGAASAHSNATSSKEIAGVAWMVFLTILVATPFYLRRVAKVQKPQQIAISTVAFFVWALAYPGLPFNTLVDPIVGSVALLLITFLIPILAV